jgi:hypothetical protein
LEGNWCQCAPCKGFETPGVTNPPGPWFAPAGSYRSGGGGNGGKGGIGVNSFFAGFREWKDDFHQLMKHITMSMDSDVDGRRSESSKRVDRRVKLDEAFKKEIFDFETYAHNITILMVEMDDIDKFKFAHSISSDILPAYAKYLADEVEACDFRPDPEVFLRTRNDESIEYTKNQYRPRYIKIVDAVKSAVNRSASSNGESV